ncbi:glycerophosphodiester phosphodiesterase family protein [Nocardioides nematodiphilus]|uniref:glycerophosphodiester phosphodiesterase family protein n=1 Tax=Nocardioides nematodiphilus TaxID=2849669 RepID=UPI001CD9CA40|nr:glycerophosphodiester phosphodiesterase family protein [Nocardioides nematodiphilus]MCA1983472.1 glycerophosphodiester phosphodiesterase [Nocardioides nematodiphilus]
MPLVIGHRGTPGHLPEHSLDSYRLAMRMGADAVETDVVMSSDGVLVVRHENELSRTTDVASRPAYADRRTVRQVADRRVEGWFSEDFTFAELRTLGAPTELDPIISLDELLLLVAEESARAGRRIGLHVEVKHPAYFAAAGLPMVQTLLGTLRDHGVERPDARVWIQSFDREFVRRMSPLTPVPLVQLVDESDGPIDCHAIAAYADAIGPNRTMVHTGSGAVLPLLAEAHRAGLLVFVWTMRGSIAEHRELFAAGVDGIFTDHADRGVAALARSVVGEPA